MNAYLQGQVMPLVEGMMLGAMGNHYAGPIGKVCFDPIGFWPDVLTCAAQHYH